MPCYEGGEKPVYLVEKDSVAITSTEKPFWRSADSSPQHYFFIITILVDFLIITTLKLIIQVGKFLPQNSQLDLELPFHYSGEYHFAADDDDDDFKTR